MVTADDIPQGLKPHEFATCFGTTEVVPFQSRLMRPLPASSAFSGRAAARPL